ncbi:MAG: hypothetical protein IKH35_11540 [Prevotella sp.]|nr:hypothetical protein [Prevotella sp.]MBR3111796.1 hypothetical protein [Prevotella sp.]
MQINLRERAAPRQLEQAIRAKLLGKGYLTNFGRLVRTIVFCVVGAVTVL